MSMASRAISRLRGFRHVVLDRASGLTTRTCSPLLAELLRPAPSSRAVLEGLEPRLLLAGSSLEIPIPSERAVVGFLIGWAVVAAMIGAMIRAMRVRGFVAWTSCRSRSF